jgi:hypothetical protein
MDYNIQFLLKFGRKCDLEKLLREGMFYAAPIKSFKRDISHDRYDKHEGLKELIHLNSSHKIQIMATEWDNWKFLPMTKGTFKGWHDDSSYHSYSLFSISKEETEEQEYFPIPEKMKEFGQHYLLIQNPKEFMRRVTKALEENNFKYIYGPIEYYNTSESHQSLGFFHKSSHHAYEKEFRILIALLHGRAKGKDMTYE